MSIPVRTKCCLFHDGFNEINLPQGQSPWGMEPDEVILFTWLLKLSSAEVTLWWVSIPIEHKQPYEFFPPFTEVYLCFQIFLSPILQSCFFQAPDHPAKPLTTAHESGYNYTSGLSNTFLLLSKVNHQVSCSKFYPLRGFLWPLVSGISQKGAVVPLLSAFKRCMHIMPNQTVCTPSLRLFFLCQVMVGNSLWESTSVWVYKCMMREKAVWQEKGPRTFGPLFM